MHHPDCSEIGDVTCACQILKERDQLRAGNARLKLGLAHAMKAEMVEEHRKGLIENCPLCEALKELGGRIPTPPPRCEHKTQEEYAVCNRCSQFALIARSSRKLLQKRQIYLDHLLGDRTKLDAAQEEMTEALKQLEESMKLADMSKIWD